MGQSIVTRRGGRLVRRCCILHHWGVQLILAYSWARPAILVVGKGRGGMFLFLLFLHFHSCSSFFPVPLFHLLYSLSSISFLPFSGRRHKMTLKGWCVVKPQHNQSIITSECLRYFTTEPEHSTVCSESLQGTLWVAKDPKRLQEDSMLCPSSIIIR